MTQKPLCCSPDAFNLLARDLPGINSPGALLSCAVAIAMHQMEGVNVGAIDKQLQRYADKVRSKVRGSQPQALLAFLHDVLFDEEGFSGNPEDYYNPFNS